MTALGPEQHVCRDMFGRISANRDPAVEYRVQARLTPCAPHSEHNIAVLLIPSLPPRPRSNAESEGASGESPPRELIFTGELFS